MNNKTSNPMQAPVGRICKYGLSLILAILAITSCNKKDAIIDRTNNFVSYSNAWIYNPATTIPQGILSELSDNDAVAYIEDAYNIVYTNRNINLIDTKSDDYNVTVPKNTNGKVAIAHLAAAFANSMTHIRSVYNTVSGPKTLDNVDVSVISTSNSNVVLHFKSFICSGALPLPVIPISGGGSTAISFSGGKQYNICNANRFLGIKGDPSSAGYDGTHYLIQALRANWTSSLLAGPGGIYATVGPLGGPRYKAINLTTNGDDYLLRVDTNFNLIDTTSDIVNTLSNHRDTFLTNFGSNVLEVSKGNVIVGPMVIIGMSFSENSNGIIKYNTTTKKVLKRSAFPHDLDSYKNRVQLGSLNNMATSGNSIYTLTQSKEYIKPRDTVSPFNYIIVAKYDTSGNPLWRQYLGDGLHVYGANSIYACKDGGVMICGYTDAVVWSSTTGRWSNNQDFYVVKLDSATGYPTSIVNISEQLRSGIVVYPNPATTELHIKGATSGSKAILYDMMGKEVYNAALDPTNCSIPISHLPTGNYLYKIIDQEGLQLSTGKWIKQ